MDREGVAASTSSGEGRDYDASVSERERELKLSVEASFAMPALEDLADGVVSVPWTPENVWTVYFDTDDLRLARWGTSMRQRLGQGWTVKLPPELDGDVLVRPEITFLGSGRRPPAAAIDLVRAFTRGKELAPRTSLRTTRRRTELRDGTGRLVADVFEDDVAVREGRRAASSFREVEVEIRDATPPELLETLVGRLSEAGATTADPTPKYVRALGSRAHEPEIAVVELGPDATAGDVLRRAIAASVTRLVVYDPVVRLDTDPEGVHQARVATRRLRSDLRTFRPLVDPLATARLREELRWLAELLGLVRDGDVLLERMRLRAAELPEGHERGAAEVLSTLESHRDVAHATLLTAIRDRRYLGLLDRLVAQANAPSLLPEAETPAVAVVPDLVRAPWQSLEKAVRRLGKKPSDAELHDLRIRTKRVRYAAEATSPVVGAEAEALARAATGLQTVLGDLNDAVVARRWLRDWATGDRTATGIAAAQELARHERAAARTARGRWRKRWARLSAPELRAWM
jgi:CHAD domain-containing protein